MFCILGFYLFVYLLFEKYRLYFFFIYYLMFDLNIIHIAVFMVRMFGHVTCSIFFGIEVLYS